MDTPIIRPRQVIKFLSPIFAGSSGDCFVIESSCNFTVGAIELTEDAISARKQEIILAVNPVINVCVIKQIPQINGRHHRRHCAERITFPTIRIADVTHPFRKGTSVAAGGERMTENADLAVNKKIVERHKIARELMVYR